MIKVHAVSLTYLYDHINIDVNDDTKLYMKNVKTFVDILNIFSKLLEEKTDEIFQLEKDSTVFPLTVSHQQPAFTTLKTIAVKSVSCVFTDDNFVLRFNDDDNLTYSLSFDQLLKIILQYCYNLITKQLVC